MFLKGAVSKMNFKNSLLTAPFWAEVKIVQIGQTEAKSLAFCESEGVRMYSERRSLFKTQSY